MDEFKGLKGTYQNGIFFSEQSCPATTIREITATKNRQNFTLVQIKDLMAEQAKQAGANAIVDFRYGQRSHKWYQHLAVRWDSESWFGEGRAVLL